MFNTENTDYSVKTVLNNFLNKIPDEKLEYEVISVEESLSRILYEDIIIDKDFPSIDKALIDGYAVNASDVTHATEESPVVLELAGEITVENNNSLVLQEKQAVKISKGAFLPKNADVIIPPEDVFTSGNKVKILKSATAGRCVAQKGEDIKAGTVFIMKNRKIRPQDIGGIIGIGYRQVKVYKKPVVTIIPTGNELVPIDVEPDINQILSSNGYVLKGFVEQLNGIARISSIVKDDLNLVKSAIQKATEVSDMVLISGGSSTGIRDYTSKALKELNNSEIVAHGVAMKPGDHVLLAMVNGKPVIGLPGHPVSNMTSFHVFGKPLIKKLSGTPRSFWQDKKDYTSFDAVLTKNVKSPEGKEDYIRVRLLEQGNGKIAAYPYTGKSSFLSTLVKSHGYVIIPEECTGLYEGDMVEVILF